MFVATSSSSVDAQQQSDALPTEPVLRLNTTGHTATIWRIATDRENRYAVTASNDKTARVWSLPDGRLLRVLRVPIGEGNMGQLYAVAMTPDGATVALGGQTGIIGQHNQSIYLLDRASGALHRRLPALPNVVYDLAYSPDGRLLAAALSGANGIRVYDANQGYQALPSDKDYGGESYGVDFDRQGHLVTVSFDGFIRLYAAGRYDTPIAKVEGRGGKRPESAAFSPDGQRVSVGYGDSTAVDLLSGKDLAFIRGADTTGMADVTMGITGWSADGRYLFAAGVAGPGKGGQVRRWEDGGTGRDTDIEAANDTVTELLQLNDGGMLFASAPAAFGIIDARGHAKIIQGPGQLDFRVALGSLRVSKTGQTVEQGSNFPKHLVRFAVGERRLDFDPPADTTLVTPVKEAQDLKVAGWQDNFHPTVNGQPIALGSYERSRNLAYCPATMASSSVRISRSDGSTAAESRSGEKWCPA